MLLDSSGRSITPLVLLLLVAVAYLYKDNIFKALNGNPLEKKEKKTAAPSGTDVEPVKTSEQDMLARQAVVESQTLREQETKEDDLSTSSPWDIPDEEDDIEEEEVKKETAPSKIPPPPKKVYGMKKIDDRLEVSKSSGMLLFLYLMFLWS